MLTTSEQLEMERETESSLSYIPILRPDVHAEPQTLHIHLELQTSFTMTPPLSRLQTLRMWSTMANWKYSQM